MKAGETGWVRVTVAETFKDGTFFVNANGFHEDDDMIPDHPALSAVARWLSDDPRNSEMLRVIVAAEAKDSEKWGMERAAGVWQSLIAALTEGQG